jgi:hypothetical protein
VDIGVGDVVYPPAEPAQFSGLLDFPQTTICCYRPETILAEKTHALVKLVKDIYDIWQIASQTKLEGNVFAKALRGTFEQRQTDFPESLVIFSSRYIHQRREVAWKAIGKRLSSVDHLPGLPKTLGQLKLFLLPIMDALYQEQAFNQRWDPAKGWAWH